MKYLVFCFTVLCLIYTCKADASPDYIDIKIAAKQHGHKSGLCLGEGMSKKLTLVAKAEAVWEVGSDAAWYLGYGREYCVLNERSKGDNIYEGGFRYRFDL